MAVHAQLAWDQADEIGGSMAPVWRMLAVSAALHLAVLAAAAGFRLPPKVERLTATQVTLVSLAQPRPEPVAPVEPVPQAAPPAPSPPPPLETKERGSAPIASKAPALPSFKESVAAKAASSKLRDALKGIEQAPEAPRLGDYKPGPRRALDTLPDVPVDTKPREKQPSLSDVAKELEALKQPQQKPVVTSKPKAAPRPVTAIQTAGDVSGLGRYLSLVQAKISEQWVAPPVDLTAKSYQVVIKFRLHKSGTISDVEIERASGNGYYDDAGKRAVLSVGALPAFPPSVTETVLETHFTFTVGEEVG
jgi:TonB family protein